MKEVEYEIFRRNLPKLRIIRGFKSANELSKKCGFKTMKRVADFETKDRGVPTLNELFTLCQELNVTIDEILFKEIEITFKVNHLK